MPYCSVALVIFVLDIYNVNTCYITYITWKICHLADSINFPQQADSDSCGPYICVMAKSIVQRCRFVLPTSVSSNYGKYLRHTIAYELRSCSLIKRS